MKQIQKLIKGLSIEELDNLLDIVSELDEFPEHKEELIKILKTQIRELELVAMIKPLVKGYISNKENNYD